jgi:hypothetical protein
MTPKNPKTALLEELSFIWGKHSPSGKPLGEKTGLTVWARTCKS